MLRRFNEVERGMSADQVESLLGSPDKIRSLTFGNETWTTWTYHADGKQLFVWFDREDRVKLKSPG